MTRSRALFLAPALLLGATAAACGTSSPGDGAPPSSAPATSAPGDPGGGGEAPPGSAPVARPTPAPEAQSAGPLTLTAEVCDVEGFDLTGTTSVVTSLAFTADHAFIAGEDQVHAFTLADDAGGCSLVLDTTMGDDGALDVDSAPMTTVSATPDGRVVASGVLGTKVFDTAAGTSYECEDVSGNVIVHPSGAYAYRWFPGSAVTRIELGETACTEGAAVPMPFADVVFLAFDGDGVLVGGKDAAGVMTAARSVDGAVTWQHNNPTSFDEDALGWLHGATPCGDGFCLADTNFDRFQVLDGAGAHRASFTISEVLGLPKGFTQTMVAGPGGSPYALTSVTDRGTTFGYVARLEATG